MLRLCLLILMSGAILITGCKKSVVNPLPKKSSLTANISITDSLVGVTTGTNTVTMTFNQKIEALNATNSNAEMTVSGCSVNPSVAITTSHVSDHSVAVATLSGGICADGDIVTVQVHLNKIKATDGLYGLASKNPADATYTINMNLPIATLNTATYAGSNTAINSSSTATLNLSLANTTTISLVDAVGTSTAPPSGLTATPTGTASCTSIEIQGSTTSGAILEVSGCTGDGTLQIQINGNIATGATGLQNAASASRSVVILNARPAATLAITNAVVSTTDGDNIITASFDSLVKDLSAINANGEFIVAGCTIAPTVIISMSVVAGKSVAIGNLTGGTCPDGASVTVTLKLDEVEDIAGNVGLSTGHPSETYTIDTTLPSVGLASTVYPGSQGAIKSPEAAIIDFTFANTDTQSLITSTGTSTSPPTGLVVSHDIGIACSHIEIQSPTTTGARIIVQNCIGDGFIDIGASSGILTSSAGLTSVASSLGRVWVQNTRPTVSITGLAPTGGAAGENSFTAIFSNLIQHPMADGSGGEFVVSGCTAGANQPGISISSSNSGNHTESVVTLSAGNCQSSDTVTINIYMENMTDAASNPGHASDNLSESYTVP